jgi:FAD/FMN-containing dehydrogenase
MTRTTIPDFDGEIVEPHDQTYDRHREVWNALVDRRPALIARCRTAHDVVSAVRYGRDAGLEIAVKCGGHSVLGLSVPDAGLMIDLSPMSAVQVDPAARRARVQGGALLRNLDCAAEPFGLATTAGNISHTGVGGLTLGGGMGWLARQFGLACDNVESYTVITADGRTLRASAEENPDLFWGLRGGGGNFGIVTEFEFRLHPISGRVLVVGLIFEADRAQEAIRNWRDLLSDAPRQATLTVDLTTAADSDSFPAAIRGRPIADVGFAWVGDPGDARNYLSAFRTIGTPVAENVAEMSYVQLQSIADDRNMHGRRRYSNGHYLRELSDEAIAAFLTRGVTATASEPDWTRVPNGGFQAYGGAIGEVGDDEAAFSHRGTLVEFSGATSWLDPAEDSERMASARSYGAVMGPHASGVYVNVIADEGVAGLRRAYSPKKLARLRELKRRYDPDNVFHLNQNIAPGISGETFVGDDVGALEDSPRPGITSE